MQDSGRSPPTLSVVAGRSGVAVRAERAMLGAVITAASFGPIVAHQYGWDELVMFAVPVVLAVAGVRYLEKRAAERKRLEQDEAEDPADADAE